ncbi:hypothetical protein ACFXB3_20750 [Streptomyces sp. NPDC059447]
MPAARAAAGPGVDHGGVFRQPVRVSQLRVDVGVEEVPLFGGGPGSAPG